MSFSSPSWRALKAQNRQTPEKNCMQQLHVFMIFITLYNRFCFVNKSLKNLGTSNQRGGVKFHKEKLKQVQKHSWLQHFFIFFPSQLSPTILNNALHSSSSQYFSWNYPSVSCSSPLQLNRTHSLWGVHAMPVQYHVLPAQLPFSIYLLFLQKTHAFVQLPIFTKPPGI